MNIIEKRQFILGITFLLANKFQMIGDSIIPDITFKQWFLLLMISREEKQGHSVNDIALLIGSSRQNTKKMVTILEKKGYLKIEKSKTDRRSLRINLTKKTYQYLQENEDIGKEELSILFSIFQEDNIDSIVDFMQKLLLQTNNFELQKGKNNEKVTFQSV